MKVAAIAALSLLFIFIGIHIYSFAAQGRQLSKDFADIQARLTKAKADEANLQEETKYLANPLNLEKELRARFNYKKPGEKMIIIVVPDATSTATSG